MKRRAALKNLGLATGFFAITPSVVSLLQSCTSNAEAWVPELFTEEQGRVLTKLVDIILPKTESLPSANELNVPQFIDKYYQQVLDNENKNKIDFIHGPTINTINPYYTIINPFINL